MNRSDSFERFTRYILRLNAAHAPFAASDCSRALMAIIMEECIPRRSPDGAGVSLRESGSDAAERCSPRR